MFEMVWKKGILEFGTFNFITCIIEKKEEKKMYIFSKMY